MRVKRNIVGPLVAVLLGCAHKEHRPSVSGSPEQPADSTPTDITKNGTSSAHLVPERNHDPRYGGMVAKTFARGFGQEVELRVTFYPSFGEPEWVAGICRRSGVPLAFVERAKESVWSVRLFELVRDGEIRSYYSDGRELTLAEQYPEGVPSLEKLTTAVAEHALDDEAAKFVTRVWATALADVHEPAPGMAALGMDGMSYQFWQRPSREGRTWSPVRGSPMQALVDVADALVTFADADDKSRPSALRALKAAADSFLAKRGNVGAERAAQQGVAPDGRPQTAARR
jgi:hypothetical protein